LLKDVRYNLHFHLPANKGDDVVGEESIEFTLPAEQSQPLPLDFKYASEAIHSLRVNGFVESRVSEDEHLYIPFWRFHAGHNIIQITFTAGNAALNRNNEF